MRLQDPNPISCAGGQACHVDVMETVPYEFDSQLAAAAFSESSVAVVSASPAVSTAPTLHFSPLLSPGCHEPDSSAPMRVEDEIPPTQPSPPTPIDSPLQDEQTTSHATAWPSGKAWRNLPPVFVTPTKEALKPQASPAGPTPVPPEVLNPAPPEVMQAQLQDEPSTPVKPAGVIVMSPEAALTPELLKSQARWAAGCRCYCLFQTFRLGCLK